MAPQRYERVRLTPASTHISSDGPIQVAANEDDGHSESPRIPSSPPPSFRSRLSSRRASFSHYQIPETPVERELEDAFGGPHDSDEESDNHEAQNLVSQPDIDAISTPPAIQRRVTEFPGATAPTTTRVYGGGAGTRDGVFANISAKPSRDDDLEEKPPVCSPFSPPLNTVLTIFRHMNRPPPTPPLHTGKPPSLLPLVTAPMTSLSMA